MNTKQLLYTYTLRLADDSLIMGHRLSELCSKAPLLEEDLALTNIALDNIGRAQALYFYAAEINGAAKTADDLAYRREEHEYLNHLLMEQPNGDFAHTMARQLFVSAFEVLFYEELMKSNDPTLSAIAGKVIKEVRYHLEHAAQWTVRLGDGTEESHRRMQKAADDLWMYSGELFEMDETDHALLQEGIAVDRIPLKTKWQQLIHGTLTEATLQIPSESPMQSGGRKGVHSENLGHILSEMQYLQRAYPDAKW